MSVFLSPRFCRFAVIAPGGLCVAMTDWLFRRLQAGQLFLFALPGELSPSPSELADAAQAGAAYYWPASLLFVVATGWGLAGIRTGRDSRPSLRTSVSHENISLATQRGEAFTETLPEVRRSFSRPMCSGIAWKRPASWLLGILVLATLADLATTMQFMHRQQIDLELHPGLKLLSYALGRTTGPVLGKLLQGAGIVAIAGLLPKFQTWLLGGASCLMMLAAAHNLHIL
jgi:hypothetical protein